MPSIAERLEAQSIPEPNSGCWLWLGPINADGYGRRQFGSGRKRRMVAAHRLSWEVHRGPIPDGLWVLHKCDVRSCVNPDHLFLGTHTDNMADMTRKERQARGERVACAKLSAADVIAIRESSASGRSLARHYGIHHSTIQEILSGAKWMHLTPAVSAGRKGA